MPTARPLIIVVAEPDLRLFGNLFDEAVIAGGVTTSVICPTNQPTTSPANTAQKALKSWKKYWLITPAPISTRREET